MKNLIPVVLLTVVLASAVYGSVSVRVARLRSETAASTCLPTTAMTDAYGLWADLSRGR